MDGVGSLYLSKHNRQCVNQTRLRTIRTVIFFKYRKKASNISWKHFMKEYKYFYRRKGNEGENYMQIIKTAYQL